MMKIEFIRQLYENEADALYSFVKKFVTSKESAEDIVQETFCIAIRKADEVIAHPNPAGWLYLVAKYLILSESRKQKKNQNHCSYHVLEDRIRDEKAELMLASLAEDVLRSVLTEEEYKIMDLVYNQGYKGKEAARLLGLNESTLRVRLFRIRHKLRKFIA